MEEGKVKGIDVINGVETDPENDDQEVDTVPLKVQVWIDEGEDYEEGNEREVVVDSLLPAKVLTPEDPEERPPSPPKENIINCLIEDCNVTFAKILHMHRHVKYVHKKDARKLIAERENKLKAQIKDNAGSDSEEEESGTPPLCVLCCCSFVPPPAPPCASGDDGAIQKEEKLYKNPQFKEFISQIVQDREGFQPELLDSKLLKRISICPDCQKIARIAMEKQAAMKEEEDKVKKLHQRIVRKIRNLPRGMANYRMEIKKLEDIISGSDSFNLEADLERKRELVKKSGNLSIDHNLVMLLRDGIVSAASELESMMKKNGHLQNEVVEGGLLSAAESDSEVSSSSSESEKEEEKTEQTQFKAKLYRACGTGTSFPQLDYNPKTETYYLGPVALIVHEEIETLECSRCEYRVAEKPYPESKIRAWQVMQKHVKMEHLNLLLAPDKTSRRGKRYRQSSSESDSESGGRGRKKRNLRARHSAPKYAIDDDKSDDDEESEQEEKRNASSDEGSDEPRRNGKKDSKTDEKRGEKKVDDVNGGLRKAVIVLEKYVHKPAASASESEEVTATTTKNEESNKKSEDDQDSEKDKRKRSKTPDSSSSSSEDVDSDSRKSSRRPKRSKKGKALDDDFDKEKEDLRSRRWSTRTRKPARYTEDAEEGKRTTSRNKKNVKYREVDSEDSSD